MMLNVAFLVLGSQSLHFENVRTWAIVIARYTIYILMTKGIHGTCALGHKAFQTGGTPNVKWIWKRCKSYLVILAAAVACMLYCKQRIVGQDFLLMFLAHLFAKYPEMGQKSVINYGTGMAYSFYEGYFAHILPSDGADFVGFEENIVKYEAQQGVVFPVKKIFLIITKSLYCPPDLKHFNKTKTNLPYLEACQPLGGVCKDVAGVKRRTYRNSAYALYRPRARPLYLAAECATPLHTLYRVLQKKSVYQELADVDPEELVRDFCSTLSSILQKNRESRDKCELVYFDDLDPTQNLADVLLDKIRDLEPDFENIISKRE